MCEQKTIADRFGVFFGGVIPVIITAIVFEHAHRTPIVSGSRIR
jgi:hypothetical protein